MLDKDAVEKGLLIGVVRQNNWKILIENSITRQYFATDNQKIYDYIKGYVDRNTYPELQLLSYEFKISEQLLMELNQIDDLQGLCDNIKKEYLKQRILYELGEINENSKEMYSNPESFILKIGDMYSNLKSVGATKRSVGLLDDIEKILEIDPSDVISTGFSELDDYLVGWRRGEDLIVFMARTGQGKSWLGLKFALAAAFQGEKVGIYSGEMSLAQLQERIICCAKPTYTSTKEEALENLKSHNIDIRILTQKELRRRANVNDIEEMIVKDKLTMLIIDQLSLMDDITCKPGTPLRQQYGNISMDLYTLSIKYILPCILLAQSNRQATQEANGPRLENLAESDAVAQNATRVISMKNENGTLTMNIIKNRYGQGDATMKYEVDYGINKYKPIKDMQQELTITRRAKAKQIFGGGTNF